MISYILILPVCLYNFLIFYIYITLCSSQSDFSYLPSKVSLNNLGYLSSYNQEMEITTDFESGKEFTSNSGTTNFLIFVNLGY